MFNVLDNTTTEIVLIYIAFVSSCLLTAPIISLVIAAIERGTEKWR